MKDNEPVDSPIQHFRRHVCTECREHVTNKGLCSSSREEVISCVTVHTFNVEYGIGRMVPPPPL